ncbi:MAG: glycosyltransferase family 39 protein [Acidobacteriales bacterium]|nr:MAG: glycosyltransferase family 39 protein [Terriglobales bacterium]
MLAVTRRWLFVLAALYFLFVFGLTDAGLIGPDEPRYASIGREMARSGDWVTPHLWGQPWFEKPPLLYWMIAAANMLDLGEELAPRLPVVLASIVFLLLYYFLLRAEFGARVALFAAAMLGTSAAWVAFSQVAVTDMPMTVAFSSAMLLGLRWLSSGDRRWLVGVAFLLGLAVLAKGLVPLVLFLPLVWAGRRRLKDWLWPLPWVVFLATVAPWYVLCYWRNGDAFLQEFFWRHHFARFTSGETLHPQPFWFYVPVLLAGLYPWIPMALPLFRKSLYADPRRRFLLVWAVFGLLFFSASAGKLPGYLLPLFPALTALAALALDEIKNARWLLVACCLLLLLLPTISATLPRALMEGLSRSRVTGWHWAFAVTVCLAAVCVSWLENKGKRHAAMHILLALVVFSVVYVKVKTLPLLDDLVSARPVWQKISKKSAEVCVDNIGRSWRYSLNYYSVTPLAECSESPRPIRIEQLPDSPPAVK